MPLKPIKGPASYPCPPGFNGRLAGPYRWFSGRPLNGHRYTDATFLRRATMATDISGHASAYQRWAGWERLVYVRLPVMASPAIVAMAIVATWPERILAVAIVAIVVARCLASRRAVAKHRREVIEPLAMAVARLVQARHVAGHGHKVVDVPMDIRDNPRATVAIRLPVHWTADEGEKKKLATLVASRLSMDNLAMALDMTGPAPMATFAPLATAPSQVAFSEVADCRCKDTELAMGLGTNGGWVLFSLALESPHLLLAAGSGAGKSELLAFLVGQFMRRGYGIAVLDAKFTSHMWARRVPGILYASESEELHEALIWLDAEMLRRARFVAAGGDPATLVPLAVVLEEMNGASNRLRSYWSTIKEQGQPQMSPALTALGNLSAMGRELRVHILMAGQSLTGKATGGPENRENFQGRALSRATAKQWAMLAPQIKPAPVKRHQPGRWHLVVGDTIKEFQAPFMDIKNEEGRLIEWATGGAAVPDVPAMMLSVSISEGSQNASSPGVPTPTALSLAEYAQARPGFSVAQLQKWRERFPGDFPEVAGTRGRAMLYEPEALDAFVSVRVRD